MMPGRRKENSMSHVDDGALHAYLDGEVTPAERADIEAHLAGCTACRTRLGEEQALLRRATELLGRAQPPDHAAPPLRTLETRRRPRRWLLPLTWAATVVLAVGLGYSLRDADEPAAAEMSATAPETQPVVVAGADRARPAPVRPPAGPARVPEPAAVATLVDSAPADRSRDSIRVDVAGRADALQEEPRALRAAAPRDAANIPAPAAALGAADRAEAAVVARRGRQVTTEWPVIQRHSARALLGTEPVGVPGLAVRQLRTSPANDGTVLIEQAVDASTVIQLYQRRTDAERDALRYGTTERLARFIDGLRVEIAGPLSQDSLNRLLEQLRPLP
jgi:hypothetical protein